MGCIEIHTTRQNQQGRKVICENYQKQSIKQKIYTMIIEIQVELEILRKEFKIVGEKAHYGV